MGRADYHDDYDDPWSLVMWRGAVASAIRGKRGQAMLVALRDALDAMPDKRLIADDYADEDGEVCALECYAKSRGRTLSDLDPIDEEHETVAARCGIATAMAREIQYENDECGIGHYVAGKYVAETAEERWKRMRRWVDRQIRCDASAAAPPVAAGGADGR